MTTGIKLGPGSHYNEPFTKQIAHRSQITASLCTSMLYELEWHVGTTYTYIWTTRCQMLLHSGICENLMYATLSGFQRGCFQCRTPWLGSHNGDFHDLNLYKFKLGIWVPPISITGEAGHEATMIFRSHINNWFSQYRHATHSLVDK